MAKKTLKAGDLRRNEKLRALSSNRDVVDRRKKTAADKRKQTDEYQVILGKLKEGLSVPAIVAAFRDSEHKITPSKVRSVANAESIIPPYATPGPQRQDKPVEGPENVIRRAATRRKQHLATEDSQNILASLQVTHNIQKTMAEFATAGITYTENQVRKIARRANITLEYEAGSHRRNRRTGPVEPTG